MSSRDGLRRPFNAGRDVLRCTEAGRGEVDDPASSDARSTLAETRFGASTPAEGRPTSSLETSLAARSTSEKARLGA